MYLCILASYNGNYIYVFRYLSVASAATIGGAQPPVPALSFKCYSFKLTLILKVTVVI